MLMATNLFQVIAKLATSFDPMERPTFGLICEELAPVLVSMDSAQVRNGGELVGFKQQLARPACVATFTE